MNDALDVLTQPFLHKSISESTVDEIKDITTSFPYCAPAQLALVKKLKESNSVEYAAQLQKAVLYYYDPVQFEAYIHSEKFLTGFDFSPATQEEVQEEADNEIPIIEESGTAAVAIEATPEPQNNLQLDTIPDDDTTEEGTEETLTFEPYHTVDYFASQGIKLSQQEVATDRVGKQLKSFTEWLKTMKRLPAATHEPQLDARSEHQVQNLAEHSIEKADIVTETMAEVWTKQGNLGKAIEVYHKLSLQNPSKKAYFAAKIDQLKKAP